MNYTVVINSAVWFGALAYYYIDARKWFTGPKITVAADDLTEAQQQAIKEDGLNIEGLEDMVGKGGGGIGSGSDAKVVWVWQFFTGRAGWLFVGWAVGVMAWEDLFFKIVSNFFMYSSPPPDNPICFWVETSKYIPLGSRSLNSGSNMQWAAVHIDDALLLYLVHQGKSSDIEFAALLMNTGYHRNPWPCIHIARVTQRSDHALSNPLAHPTRLSHRRLKRPNYSDYVHNVCDSVELGFVFSLSQNTIVSSARACHFQRFCLSFDGCWMKKYLDLCILKPLSTNLITIGCNSFNFGFHIICSSYIYSVRAKTYF